MIGPTGGVSGLGGAGAVRRSVGRGRMAVAGAGLGGADGDERSQRGGDGLGGGPGDRFRGQGLAEHGVDDDRRGRVGEGDRPQRAVLVGDRADVPDEGLVAQQGRRGGAVGAADHEGVAVAGPEPGETVVLDVIPPVRIDLQIDQVRGGADSVDEVVGVGFEAVGDGGGQGGEELDGRVAGDVGPPPFGGAGTGARGDDQVRAAAFGPLVVVHGDAPAGTGDRERERAHPAQPVTCRAERRYMRLVLGGPARRQIAGADVDGAVSRGLVVVVCHGGIPYTGWSAAHRHVDRGRMRGGRGEAGQSRSTRA